MATSTIIYLVGGVIALIILIALIAKSIVTVQQNTVDVVTKFGEYKKILTPGLNFINPFFDKIFSSISLQNITMESSFQAVTSDQANVYFKALILYSVLDTSEETIKNVAFKFIDIKDLKTALTRKIESSIRGYVSTKKQSEVLQIKSEIISHAKSELDEQLSNWGYHLIDLQLNDITFDQVIMDSMSQVVASFNLKAAAENEGAALLIKETKKKQKQKVLQLK